MDKGLCQVGGLKKKIRYEDEISAKLALAQLRFKDSPGRPRTESRVYRCRACKGYHLTSKPLRKPLKPLPGVQS